MTSSVPIMTSSSVDKKDYEAIEENKILQFEQIVIYINILPNVLP